MAGVNSPPACVTVDSTNHIFNVNAANCTINGWDFTGNGGWQVSSCGTSGSPFNNLTITNSHFKVGANSQIPILAQGFANSCGTPTGLTITNNVIDINNAGGSGSFEGIAADYSGTVTIEYNYILNSSCDLIDTNSDPSVGQTLIVKYNLLYNGGQTVGGHADVVQLFDNTGFSALYNSITVDFNTQVQTIIPATNATAGFTLQANCHTPNVSITNGDASNNTFVDVSNNGSIGGTSYAIAVSSGNTTGAWTVENNYVDPTGISGVGGFVFVNSGGCGSDSGTITFSGNTSLVTGSNVN